MSEYQDFQWACVTRRLTPDQRSEVSGLSSHIRVGSHDAEVTYQWGDFKHDPEKVLQRYFDVYTYIANWGSQEIFFRFPASTELAEALDPFTVCESLFLNTSSADLIFGAVFDENWAQHDNSWEFEDSIISSAAGSIYQEILQHDLRGPFLLWLKACEWEGDSSDGLEVAVPPGLNELQAHHQTVIDFISIDPIHLQEAAKLSPPLEKTDPGIALAGEEAVAELTSVEKDTFLLRLISEDPYLVRESLIELLHRKDPIPIACGPRIDFASLATRAEAAREQEKRRRTAEAELKRKQHLDALAQREGEIWIQVDELVALKNTKAYDQAILLLRDLHDFYTARKTLESFLNRVTVIVQTHPRLTGFRSRVQEAGWIG